MNDYCPLCRSAANRDAPLDNGFTLYRCGSCSFAFVLPRPGIEELKAVYDPPPEWSSMPRTNDEARQIGAKFDRLISRHTAGRKVLEVGCNSGFILHGLKTVGYTVSGTDLSETALAYARREYGLTELYCSEFPPDDQIGSFDVVIASHIIEHVIDPVHFVKECSRFLKPDGLLLLFTPNLRSIGMRSFGPHYPVFCPPIHLNYFSVQTLSNLLKASFETVMFKTESYWRDPRNTVFNCLVSVSHLLGIKGRLKNSALCQAEPGKRAAEPAGMMSLLKRASHLAQLTALPLFAVSDWGGGGENITLLARKKP